MRVRRSQPAFTSLELLVQFLNFAFDSQGKVKLGENRAVRLLLYTVYRSKVQKGLKEAGKLQKQIIEDITPLLARDRAEDVQGEQAVLSYLKALVQKVNRLRLRSEWIVAFGDQEIRIHDDERNEAIIFKPLSLQNPFFLGPPSFGPKQRILKIRNTKWIVYRQLFDESSLRKWLYAILISILEDGNFASLRRCEECQKFFIAEDVRKQFCGDDCKTAFHNERRLAEGYFFDYRIKTRKRKLIRARRLLKSGKSQYEVIEETGLSRRAVGQIAEKI